MERIRFVAVAVAGGESTKGLWPLSWVA
jgi:hypothetical protein